MTFIIVIVIQLDHIIYLEILWWDIKTEILTHSNLSSNITYRLQSKYITSEWHPMVECVQRVKNIKHETNSTINTLLVKNVGIINGMSGDKEIRYNVLYLLLYNILYIFFIKLVVYYIIITCNLNIFEYTTLSHSKKDIIS